MQGRAHNSNNTRGGSNPRSRPCWEPRSASLPIEHCATRVEVYFKILAGGLGLMRVAALVLLLTVEAVCAPQGDAAQTGQRGNQQNLPASLQGMFSRGVEAQKAGQLDAAEKAFLRVLREGGKVAFVYNNLGIVYQMRGEHPQAISQFREAIRLQPDYAAPHILMGASLLALGDILEATRELERGVKLQPREALARLELAKAYERADNLPDMVDQMRSLRELSPQEPEYAYQLGSAYLKLAAWCYKQIKTLNPRSARVYQTLAENYRLQGRLELALHAFQNAAEADPKLPGIHLALAQIYLEQGNAPEARMEVDQELAIVPESTIARVLKRKIEAAAPKPH